MTEKIGITPRAAKRIEEILAVANREGQGLRLKVVGGGPAGLKYDLNLDIERPRDLVFEQARAKLLVDSRSLLYLEGKEIDYEESLMSSGFAIRDTHLKQACPSSHFPVYCEEPSIPNIW